MGFLNDEEEVTNKGFFASRIYNREVLVTELFYSELYKDLSDIELSIIVGSIAYEPRKKDYFQFPKDKRIVKRIQGLISGNSFVASKINNQTLMRLTKLIKRWCEGCEFSELLDYTNLDEGDIIRFFRQMIDVERQIMKASTDEELRYKIGRCIDLVQRDVVKVDTGNPCFSTSCRCQHGWGVPSGDKIVFLGTVSNGKHVCAFRSHIFIYFDLSETVQL